MDQFTVSYDYANEAPSSALHYPKVTEETYQWKSKQKPKKVKSPDDEGKTEVTSDRSTFDASGDGSEVEWSTSVVYSQTSVSSKKSKKRDRQPKKVVSEHSMSVNADFNILYESSPDKQSERGEYSPFATLSCPVCSDPDCVLNVAATCPLLRHNEEEVTQCALCEEDCECGKCKSKFLPVSGLVARDENGVAETLLKKNGGPIENSLEWASRSRWIVPYGINWDHQVDEWITSRMRETSKTTLEGSNRKHTKSKFGKKKGKHPSSPSGALSQVVMSSDNSNQEHKGDEMKVLLDGNGFKIFSRGQEKVLINFDRKNCKYLGCSCQIDNPNASCGCNSWQDENHSKKSKRGKSCKMPKHSPRVSLMKETSHGLIEVCAKDLEKCEKSNPAVTIDKNERNEQETGEVKELKTDSSEIRQDQSNEKNPEKVEGEKLKEAVDEDKSSIRRNLTSGLSARDVRNISRAQLLEQHLRKTLGDSYKEGAQMTTQVAVSLPEGCTMMMYTSVQQGTAEVMMAPMEMMGPCMCAERYGYTSA